MKKAWVITLSTIDAAMYVKHPRMDGLKVLSLISSRKGDRYIQDQLRSIWQIFRMDWYGLQGNFNLDAINKTFDQKIQNRQTLLYIHESSYTLKAEKSDIKNIEILDVQKYRVTWKPHAYVETDYSDLKKSKIIESEERTASAASVDMRDFFK